METADIKPMCDFTAAWTPLRDELKDVPGDVAEFGVYNGGSTRILSRLFPERTVWAFDTYGGLPEEDYTVGLDRDLIGAFYPDHSIEEMFGDFLNIIPVKGRFSRTLPMFPLRPKLAFVYLDCDLHGSAMNVFDWLPGHLAGGAITFVDDYSTHPGIQKAVDCFVREHGLQFDGQHVIRWASVR